jgi:hypothetical protein
MQLLDVDMWGRWVMGPIGVPKWVGVLGDRWIWCLTLDATSNVFTNAKKTCAVRRTLCKYGGF